MMAKQEEKAFAAFLSSEVFDGRLDDFRQFRGGEFSYDFFVKSKGEDWVVKLLKNPYKVSSTVAFLRERSREVPVLRGAVYDRIFKYKDVCATVQKNYGTPLPRRKISFEQMAEIFAAYEAFSGLKAPASADFVADCFVNEAQKLYDKCDGKNSIKSRLILKFLQEISLESLYLDKKKARVIHGDFFNNQILFQNGKLSAFIDWDDVRTGYPTEDFWHFLHYNLDKIAFPFVRRFWQKKLTRQILALTDEKPDTWQTAINIMLLRRLCKLDEKFSLGRFWRYLVLRRLSFDVMEDIYHYQKEAAVYSNRLFGEMVSFKRIK